MCTCVRVHVCTCVCTRVCMDVCIRPCVFGIITGCWLVPDPHDHHPWLTEDTHGHYQCIHAMLHFGVPGYTDLLLITLALVAQRLKRLPGMQETWVRSLEIPWRRKWQPTPVLLP